MASTQRDGFADTLIHVGFLRFGLPVGVIGSILDHFIFHAGEPDPARRLLSSIFFSVPLLTLLFTLFVLYAGRLRSIRLPFAKSSTSWLVGWLCIWIVLVGIETAQLMRDSRAGVPLANSVTALASAVVATVATVAVLVSRARSRMKERGNRDASRTGSDRPA